MNRSQQILNQHAIAFLIIAGLLTFSTFFCFFHFETQAVLYSTFLPGSGDLEKIPVFQAGQRFKIDAKNQGFNKISLLFTNPEGENIQCEFNLRTKRNGTILVSKIILLNQTPGEFQIQDISFPLQDINRRQTYYYELKSLNHPFYVYKRKPGANADHYYSRAFFNEKAGDFSLVFGIYLQEKTSILSYLLGGGGVKNRFPALAFVLASLVSLAWAVFFFYKIMPGKQGEPTTPQYEHSLERNHILIIIFLAFFLFMVIATGFMIRSNTYSKLWGAEDDAFITYKYAKNLSEGKGFRFNSDEKVLGTTTPLYTLLLSFFGLLGAKIPLASLIINGISILLAGIIIYLVLAKQVSPWPGFAGGIIYVSFPMFYRIIGMETNFLILLILFGVYLFSQDKVNPAFLVMGLAALTRTEALILLPLFILSLIYQHEYRKILKAIGIFLVTVLPWYLFAYLYFGQPLPNTFYIKTSAEWYSGKNLFAVLGDTVQQIFSLEFFKRMFLKGFISYLEEYIQYYRWWMLLFLIGLVSSLQYLLARNNFIRLYTAWTVLYVFSFALLNVSLFIWYYVLALAVIPIFLALGIHSWFRVLQAHFKPKILLYVKALVIIGLVVFEGKCIYDIFYSQWYERHIPHLERYETYLNISDYINKNIPRDKTIAMEEIGIPGYYTDHKIWDLYCLVHEAQRFPFTFPAESPQRIPYFLTLMDPDYVLFNSIRLHSQVVFRNYREIKIFPVKRTKPRVDFYYSLLKKNRDTLVLLGGVHLADKLPGKSTIKGWVMGNEKIDAVDILIDNERMATTSEFFKSPRDFQELFRYNHFSKQALFQIVLDTTPVVKGIHTIVFRARAGEKTGIFWKSSIEISGTSAIHRF